MLREFYVAAQAVRKSYETNGPNRLKPELFSPVESLFQKLSTSTGDAELLAALATVKKLCYRCVHHTEGLCFVTGEFGLVPRADLVQEFDNALELIRRHLET